MASPSVAIALLAVGGREAFLTSVALEACEELGIRPVAILGTSIGATLSRHFCGRIAHHLGSIAHRRQYVSVNLSRLQSGGKCGADDSPNRCSRDRDRTNP